MAYVVTHAFWYFQQCIFIQILFDYCMLDHKMRLKSLYTAVQNTLIWMLEYNIVPSLIVFSSKWKDPLGWYIKQIMNVLHFCIFNSLKDGMFHTSRLCLLEWNIPFFKNKNTFFITLINLYWSLVLWKGCHDSRIWLKFVIIKGNLYKYQKMIYEPQNCLCIEIKIVLRWK